MGYFHKQPIFCYDMIMNISEITQNIPTYREDFKNDHRWLKHETAHYVFYYFPKSIAEIEIDQISGRQENGFEKIINFLQVPIPRRKIIYYIYPNADVKKELMGDDWYAQAIWKDFVVHILYTEKIKPVGEHEDTHLLSLPWGLSIAFFQEGLAEYMVGHGWHGEDHNSLTKEAFGRSLVPKIESMMEHKKWQELDDEYALFNYAFVASFTKFLIDSFGKEKFEALYKTTNRLNTREENILIFERVYGFSINDAEIKWKNTVA